VKQNPTVGSKKGWLRLFNVSEVFFLISETMTQIQTEDNRLPGVEMAASFYRLTYCENKKAKIPLVFIHYSRERCTLIPIKKRHFLINTHYCFAKKNSIYCS